VLPNNAAGHSKLCRLLAEHGVKRVGLEATGGYERTLVTALASPLARGEGSHGGGAHLCELKGPYPRQ
jgi:hypothetical protein